jgi:hypothetical protein
MLCSNHGGGAGVLRRTLSRQGRREASPRDGSWRVRRTEHPPPSRHPKSAREVPRRRARRAQTLSIQLLPATSVRYPGEYDEIAPATVGHKRF